MAAERRLTAWMWGVGGVTFLAGLLFGYDQGVGPGALPLAAGVLLAVGTLIEAVAPGAGMLTFGRVVTGLRVGFASVVAPPYAAELAPKKGARMLDEEAA